MHAFFAMMSWGMTKAEDAGEQQQQRQDGWAREMVGMIPYLDLESAFKESKQTLLGSLPLCSIRFSRIPYLLSTLIARSTGHPLAARLDTVLPIDSVYPDPSILGDVSNSSPAAFCMTSWDRDGMER